MQRRNQQNRRNNRRRPQRNNGNNKSTNVSLSPSTTLKRTLTSQQLYAMNEIRGTNVVYKKYLSFKFPDFQGYTALKQTWEQYRISKIRVYIHSGQTTFVPGVALGASMLDLMRSPLVQNQSTIVYSAVDVGMTSVAGADIWGYNNVAHTTLSSSMRKIADFVPKIQTIYNPAVIRTANTYCSTQVDDEKYGGLQLYIVNSNGEPFFESANTNPPTLRRPQTFNITVEADFIFKQPAYLSQNTVNSPLHSGDRILNEVIEISDDEADGAEDSKREINNA